MQADARQGARCDTTHAQYAVFQDKDSIGVAQMIAYTKDPSGTPGLWRTERKESPAGTSYLLLEKDSISFHTLETKYPYRTSGDSLYFQTQ